MLACLAGTAAAGAIAQQPARVEAFSPQGEVKGVRQLTARFSEPMVSFGDPRLESPFTIECTGATGAAAQGHARWADARHWVNDFDADLPAGLRCSASLRAGVRSAAGALLAPARFAFNTGGPAVVQTWPSEGDKAIDERQVFLLGLDAAADAQSVREHAACSVAGIGERIPLEILEGDARAKLLAQQKDRARNFFLVINKRGQAGVLAVKDSRLAQAKVVVARCACPLPPGAVLNLVWGAGLMSASGVPTRQDQILRYRVRPDFVIKQSCLRIQPDAGCVPVVPIELSFSAPVARAQAARITLTAADGTLMHPQPDAQAGSAPSVESVRFSAARCACADGARPGGAGSAAAQAASPARRELMAEATPDRARDDLSEVPCQ